MIYDLSFIFTPTLTKKSFDDFEPRLAVIDMFHT